MTARLPTFLIIGAQKSATRWLRHNLGQHPQIFTAPREIAFFNSERYDSEGVEWYREQFADSGDEPFAGEATPAYMMWRHDPAVVAARIESVLPEAQLIALLRSPVDRASSAFVHHINNDRLPRDADLLDYVRSIPAADDPLGIVAGGWYAASLAPFAQRFGDRVLVLVHDDIATDPVGVYESAVAHVGAKTGCAPRDVAKVRFSYQRNETAEHGRPLDEDERRELWEHFRADVAALDAMVGRNLTALWAPS